VIAFLFPGQGSQKVGMGKALAEAYPEARAVFEEADAALGFSLSKLCFEGPAEELTLTANAQPAILATSIAALRALQPRTDLRAGVVAGHSLGEYSALVAAGALRLTDAVRVVNLRGKFMQEAVAPGEGAMAAIVNLDRAGVEAVCAEAARELGAVVSPANHNGGGQIVIAGAKAAVDRAAALTKERGGKAIPLKVSAPFHCALMKPAADRLGAELARIEVVAPSVPVVTNVEAAPSTDPVRLKALLVEQVTAPVRWEESVQRIVAMGATRALEVGAGNVLAGLVKRIAPELPVQGTGEPEAVQALGGA
jgi:[acyl-carrier-protein] S-malonyltransferase